MGLLTSSRKAPLGKNLPSLSRDHCLQLEAIKEELELIIVAGFPTWSDKAHSFLRSLPARLACTSPEEQRLVKYAGYLEKLSLYFFQKHGAHLQFVLPAAAGVFLDLVESALNRGSFPNGRTIIRKISDSLEGLLLDLDSGKQINIISSERKKRATEFVQTFELYPPSDNLVSKRLIDGSRGYANKIAQLAAKVEDLGMHWKDYPDSYFSTDLLKIENIEIYRYTANSDGLVSALNEAESFQVEWLRQGKLGMKKVFSAAQMLDILNEDQTQTSVLRFMYEQKTLGYYIIQDNPDKLSKLYKDRILKSDMDDYYKSCGYKSAWLFLAITNPESGAGSPTQAFQRDFRFSPYVLMTSVGQDCVIHNDGEMIFAVVRQGSPALFQHENVGLFSTGTDIPNEAGDFRMMAMPAETPEIVLHDIRILGKKINRERDIKA